MEVEMLLERGDILMDQGRFKDAEKMIKQALEKEPDNADALALMGRCYMNNKQIDEGIRIVSRALAIDPNNSFFFYLLGFGYYHKDENLIAETNLNKAIEIDPLNAEYFGLLSLVLIDQKHFERALDTSNSGLALDPNNITCLNARSIALNKLKRIDEAFKTMDSTLAHDPDNEVTHTVVGWNLLERGNHKKALHHFREALRIDPDFENARSGMKEAMKSRILPYKWLLQYSFWINNKGRKLQAVLPILLYVAFRILIGISNAGNTSELTWILIATYILIIVTSWTIGSIANFILLFHPTGKYALSAGEKWSAINVVTVMMIGISIMGLSSFTSIADQADYADGLFFAGMICLSLALPLGNIKYPITAAQGWREWYGVCLAGLGILSVLLFAMNPGMGSALFILYGLGFLIYNWTGIISH